MLRDYIDRELEEIITRRVKRPMTRPIIFSTGITSSHLGDERNLREYFIADLIVKHLRQLNINVQFLLFDDSYDPLNFRQLRVAVKKDEVLIKRYQDYCGTPIKLIPDPYECHPNYSAHFINEIVSRLSRLDIHVNVIDTYSSYETGMYDWAKKIIFSRMSEVYSFLKEQFPLYTMKKLFWPVCPECKKMDEAGVDEVNGDEVVVHCGRCQSQYKGPWQDTPGKFSWKIDEAVKWNVYHCDFEPFSKAYLDPDLGSYVISKKLSDKFFGGNAPEIIQYGQVFMSKELSYTLMTSLPRAVFDNLFLENRKKDMTISREKVIQATKKYNVRPDLSFYDYVQSILPYDNLDTLNSAKSDHQSDTLIQYGNEFARYFLHTNLYPTIPSSVELTVLNNEDLKTIRDLFLWIVEHKINNKADSFDAFLNMVNEYMLNKKIIKMKLFPILRKILSMQKGAPMTRIFYHMPMEFLYALVFVLNQCFEVRNRADEA